MNEPTCGDCGQELTLVRPGKHQCDNPNCVQNNSKPEPVPSCGAKSVIEERLLNAFYKALQWEDGEITGVDMKKLEQKVHGILTKH